MIDSRTLEKIETLDERSWGMIYKKLVFYAQNKLDKAGFEIRTEKDSVDAEHFAILAIERLLDGTRKWDFERYPDVTIHLIWIVKSLISSHFKSSSRSIIKAGSNVDTILIDNDDENIEDFNEDIRTTESPEEILIANEDWQGIKIAFGVYKDEHAIFCEWLEGSPPRTIAESFEISASEVYNVIKKGKRIVKTLFNKQSWKTLK